VRLRALAPAKVNLCLFLGPIREDRRHELVTLFESVSLADELVLTGLSAGPDRVVCRGVEGPNLVTGALEGLRATGWGAPPVKIEIEKRIPVAAGMGGGSADAAAALRLAQVLEPASAEAVAGLAAGLGADVPSQLEPGVSVGTGAGERVAPVAALAAHAFVIVPLPFQLSTPAVYAEADRLGLPRDRVALEGELARLWDALAPAARLPESLIVNDLQAAAVSLRPEISEALDAVSATGADQAFVSGSGPTVVGLHWGDDAVRRADDAVTSLAGRFPAATAAVPAARGLGAPEPA
jgi:4-diphosphocytidyl-2-C-methyl-D-erythritol kinase